MTFHPQYSFWGIETFKDPEGATFEVAPDGTQLVGYFGGVAMEMPNHTTGNYVTYDGGPWKKVANWCIETTMDSYTGLADHLHQQVGTGGLLYQGTGMGGQGWITESPDLNTGAAWQTGTYAWQTGQHSAIAIAGLSASYPCAGGSLGHMTTEFDVQVYSGENYFPTDKTGEGYTGVIGPSFIPNWVNVIPSAPGRFGIVEMRPDGIKVHGRSGAFLPADMTGKMRRVRVGVNFGDAFFQAKAPTSNITVALEDGSSIFVHEPTRDTAFLQVAFQAAFGMLSMTGGGDVAKPANEQARWTGHNTLANDGCFSFVDYHDPLGMTGWAGFSGKAMWDNIKITTLENALNPPTGEQVIDYHAQPQSLTTAPWHIHPNAQGYLGAWVDYLPGSGASTMSVTVQHLAPSGSYSLSDWVDSPDTETLIITGQGSAPNHESTAYIDLTNVPLFGAPHDNQIRYQIEFTPVNDAPPPACETIVTVGEHPVKQAEFHPNWKMSALPQDIFVSVDEEVFLNTPSQPDHQDQWFFHNEGGAAELLVGAHITGSKVGVSGGVYPGIVGLSSVEPTPPTGKLARVDDGVFGLPAWANHSPVGSGFTGQWHTQGTYHMSTGIYQGTLLDTYTHFPLDNIDSYTGLSTSLMTVSTEVLDYVGLEGETVPVQKVNVQGWSTDDANHANLAVGIAQDSIGIPTGAIQPIVGIYEGVIQITKGPGVQVTIADDHARHTYYLDGHNYRDPQTFRVATMLTGDRSAERTGNWIAFGCTPRNAEPTGLDTGLWKDWIDTVEEHAEDEFLIYNLTGWTADHTMVIMSGIDGDTNGQPIGLDRDFIFNSGGTFEDNAGLLPYQPVDRESFLVEGWVRPYGITGNTQAGTTNSGMLWEFANRQEEPGNGGYSLEGLQVWLHNDGNVKCLFNTAMGPASLGTTGYNTGFSGCGINSVGKAEMGAGDPFTLDSQGKTLTWGQWNHIGLCMDIRAMGDTFSGANQPLLFDEEDELTHGARISRAYLLVNGEPVDHQELSVDTYAGRHRIDGGHVAPGLPSTGSPAAAWPPIPRWKTALYATDGSSTVNTVHDRRVTLGSGVIGDFDHVRFATRGKVDTYADVALLGAKAGPPTFQPWNAPKCPVPESGKFFHMEFAHIFRLDYGSDYFGWDEGYSPNHLHIRHESLSDEQIENYGVNSDLFISRVEGPKGRDGVRVGPGATLKMEWSSWDERIFNGTGSIFLATAARPYTDDMLDSATGQGDKYKRTSANSHVRVGGWVKPHRWPDGSDDLVMDLFTLDERHSDANYGGGQLYVGVNNTGALVYGTRRAWNPEGQRAVGPFTGGPIPSGEWTHIGLDANLHETPEHDEGVKPYIRLYISGELNTGSNLGMSLVGASNDPYTGAGFGYAGWLDGALGHESVWRFGGLPPVNVTDRDWLYQYCDCSFSEIVVGYSIDEGDPSQWDWAKFATTGDNFTGKADVAYQDLTNEIGRVIGTGNTSQSLATGVFTYPETPFADAGLKAIWVTAGANDFEKLFFGGMVLFGDGNFMNAQSYYAIYENDNAAQVLGTTDSPIQIASNVPDNGINLALIANREWSVDASLSAFDLSDENPANTTNKHLGDLHVEFGSDGKITDELISDPNDWWGLGTLELDSDDIDLTSFSLEHPDMSNERAGFFCHLLGGVDRGVYIPNAVNHLDATGATGDYLANVQKIRDSIQPRDVDGLKIAYEDFPFSVICSPYAPDVDLTVAGLTGGAERMGFGTGFVTGEANDNGTFTVMVVANHQSIGQSVFLHYPSIDYEDGTVNLQDSEVYNPVPLMRRQVNVADISGHLQPKTGYYTQAKGASQSQYSTYVWFGELEQGFTNSD